MEHREKDKKVYAGFLMCPSGHVEPGEKLERTLEREMNEELGIEIEKSRLLFAIDDRDPFSGREFTHNFMLVESYNGVISNSRESVGLEWLTYEKAMKQDPPPVVKKLLARLRGNSLF